MVRLAQLALVLPALAAVVLLGSTTPGLCILGVLAAVVLAIGVVASAVRIAPELVRVARES